MKRVCIFGVPPIPGKRLRRFGLALLAACAAAPILPAADAPAAVEEIQAGERRSVNHTKWHEYDFSDKARLNSDYHHYIQFNLDLLRSKPGIVIEHAELVLKGGEAHIRKDPDAEWGVTVNVHPVLRFNFSGTPPALDQRIAAVGSFQEDRDAVFDVTDLVSGWFTGKYTGQIGAVALECDAPKGYGFPQTLRGGSISGDREGASLRVRFRSSGNGGSAPEAPLNGDRNLLRGATIASTAAAPDSPPPESLLGGEPVQGFAFADNESSSRVAVSGFVSPVRQIDLRDTAADSRSARLVNVRSSLKTQNSLRAEDYETDLGSFIPVFRPVQTAAGKVAYAVSLAVDAPEGTRSLYLDFGPSAAFVNGAEGVGTRLAGIQAFAERNTEALRRPRTRIPLPDKTGRIRYNIASLNKKTPYGKKLCSEYPELDIIGSCLYDHHMFYSPDQRDTYHRSAPGFPFTRHNMIDAKEIADSLVMLSNGVPIDPASPDFQKFRYHADRAFALQNPALLAAWEKLMPNCRARGYEGLIFADHHYPHPFKYLSGGYSRIETEAFRRDLSGSDDGLSLYDADGKAVVWKFWDYFRFYYGFVWTPADVGLKSWDEYSAYKGNWVNRSAEQNRRQLLHYVLLRYSMLKFDGSIGRLMAKNDLKYFPMYYGEAPWNATDFLIALRTVGISVVGHEQFSQSPTGFQNLQDHTLEVPYSYWGKLYRENPYSRNRLCAVFEVSHNGVRRDPYWSPAFTFAHTLDIIMAGNLRSFAMDFFPGCDPESDEWKLKDSVFRASLSAASVASVPGMKFNPLPRRILVIGNRETDRMNCPFVPNSLDQRGNGQGGFGAFELGSFPWLLNRLGMEFDFSDPTLSGVDPAQYSVIIYDARDLPDGLFPKLQNWLRESPKRTLMTHGVLPTRRISSPDWDAAHPVVVRYEGQKLVDPAAGAALGLLRITPGEAVTQPVEAADGTAPAVPCDLSGIPFSKEIPTYCAEGVRPLLVSGNQTVLSECATEGGRLLYFHYDFGRKSNAAFDLPLLAALLRRCGENSVYAELPAKHMSAHIHLPESEPETRIVVVRDRECIENEVMNNTHGRTMNFLLGPAPGLESQVALSRWNEEELTVCSFNTGESHTVSPAEKTVRLALNGQMSDVFLIKPSRSNSDLLSRLKKERGHLSPHMGKEIDAKLLEIYAKTKAAAPGK